jgi:hypothetical protein
MKLLSRQIRRKLNSGNNSCSRVSNFPSKPKQWENEIIDCVCVCVCVCVCEQSAEENI